MREPDRTKTTAWRRLRSRLGRDLIRDESGGVLIYMTILIPVMMGIIGLAVDASRLYILNTEQKDLADAAAIAGAWELDGEDDSMSRAELAAREAVTNDPRWGSDQPGIHVESVQFCENLTGPAHKRSCDQYLDKSDPDDATRAFHIEVVTEARSVFPSFLVAIGAASRPQTAAIAIAGTSVVACNVQSLMICNPFEDPDNPENSKPFSADEGWMFVFKAKQKDKDAEPGGGGQSFAPGDFGLLDHPDYPTGGGAPATRALLSQQSHPVCIHNLVNPHQGHEVQMVNQGINVRFGDPPTSEGGKIPVDATAAPHALRGTDDACGTNNPDYNDHPQYPMDTDLSTDTGAVQIGNGFMEPSDKNDYWSYHHGAGKVWPPGITTRYQAYLEEIDMLPPADWTTDAEIKEDPAPGPGCNPVSEFGAERRVMNAAVIDCLKYGVKGNSVNRIRADIYAEFFISHPAKDGTIYTEFIRQMDPDDNDSKLKRIVQLYR